MRKNRDYWTKEMCLNEALKYNTRTNFSRQSSTAYETLRKNNWLNEACNHMKRPYDVKFKWSLETCKELALKYQHRKQFQKENKNAYYSAMYNGWLDEICKHMTYQKLPNKYWHDYDNCKIEALKYSVKSDFIKNSQHVYSIALKNGWISEICKHMTPIGDRYNKCIYSYEFPDNHVYVGLTYNIVVRQASRVRNDKDAVTIYMKKTGLIPIVKQLTEYIPVDEAIILEKQYLDEYINNGWIGLNRRETGGIGSSTPVWNYERVKKIASKYNNSICFKNDDAELYSISERSGWIISFFPNEFT